MRDVRISDEHITHWHEHGYVIVEHFLTEFELQQAQANVACYMPTWEEYAAAPARYLPLLRQRDLAVAEFPFVGDTLNGICTHADLASLAERILGTTDIALSHSQLVGKYAGAANYEQSLHLDYRNNTLAYPKNDLSYFDVPMILYYSDVSEELGPTHVLSQQHSPTGPLPHQLPRADHPELYELETPATVPAGSILIYSMRTYHRGSAIRATEGARFSHHMGLRVATYRWLGQSAFQHKGGTPEMDRFIQRASPRQRELVGFPPAGHRYWDQETLVGIADRYPDMDMTPYQATVEAMEST
jgi:hypothetical protein